MKRILVPTDFSHAADRALDYALKLAGQNDAEVIALHTVELPLPEYAVQPEGIQDYNHYRVEEARLKLETYYSRFENTDKLTTVLVNGSVTEAVPDKALQYDVDLIVMGTRGADGIRVMLGSNASNVLTRSAVPVLVVPEAYKGGLPAKIVLAVQNQESEFLLAPVFALQALCNASLITLHFTSDEMPQQKRMERAGQLAVLRDKWEQDFGAEDVASEVISGREFNESLDRFVEEQSVDLVAMVTHRRHGLPGLFQKSLTRERAFHTRVPLLSIHI
ncbi:MAG: universal stress protein [Chitinophagaceae bacterium]|nr:MAG: universal stress protein [Chitinophagaceae bacterium]